jgi:hypothetical protein
MIAVVVIAMYYEYKYHTTYKSLASDDPARANALRNRNICGVVAVIASIIAVVCLWKKRDNTPSSKIVDISDTASNVINSAEFDQYKQYLFNYLLRFVLYLDKLCKIQNLSQSPMNDFNKKYKIDIQQEFATYMILSPKKKHALQDDVAKLLQTHKIF